MSTGRSWRRNISTGVARGRWSASASMAARPRTRPRTICSNSRLPAPPRWSAHEAALRHRDRYGIRKVEDVTSDDGSRSFRLQDLNYTWWEIVNVDLSYYDAIFAGADLGVAA